MKKADKYTKLEGIPYFISIHIFLQKKEASFHEINSL